MMRTGLWLAGVIAALALTAGAQTRVETIEGVRSGELVAITPQTLTLKAKDKTEKIQLSTVFSIRFVGAKRTSKATRFSLVGGDRYHGKLIEGTGDELVVDTKSCGRVTLMIDNLTEIRFPMAPKAAAKIREIPARKGKDIVYLRSGDHAYGRLGDIAGQQDGTFIFSMKVDDETLRFRQGEVYRIQIQPFNKAPEQARFHMIVSCWDGSTFSATLDKFSERILHARSLTGTPRQIALSSIRSLQFKNGSFFYLSDLKPGKIEHTPYFSYRWPPRFDRNRRGGPLTLRGKVYSKGIGMQSKTRISYPIGGKGYREFRCVVGIDDMAGDGGSVTFRVYLDGKRAHETAVLRGGTPPVALKIPLGKATTLTLEADYADNAHVNDLANWVNPILLK